MKAKKYSFKSNPILLVFLFIIAFGFNSINAQCPTVTDNAQSLCNLQSVLVGDLQAIDNGGGIVWYDTATSTVPLSNSDNLINGEDYYADDNTGSCGARQRVDITIVVQPVGNNFQGICVDNSNLATVSDLVATGNDVQWYLSPSGGLPLNDTDILVDDTLYYADQASADGSCRTSRLAVLVNVGLTPTPTGDMIQEFCIDSGFTPTVSDLVASGNNNWYISLFSAFPLPANTPLIDGQTYYVTTIDPPCESPGRLFVTVVLESGPDAGEDGTLELCSNNTSTVNLFDSLEGSPDPGGTWSPALNSGTGVFDQNIDPAIEYTYSVDSNNTCASESATVTVSIIPEPDAGTDGTLEICSNSNSIDLFSLLGGSPEVGGTWSPSLASGTNIFNPQLDGDGIYTYTVLGNTPCANATSTVTITVTPYRDAGENGSIDLCDSDGIIDLFDSLGGTPTAGGTWSPVLNSGTGIFDPLVDSAGSYTYSFTGNAPCPDEEAIVTVGVNALSNAGLDATIEICSNDLALINLFDNLGGSPEAGGTWSPALASGTGIFNPSVDAEGIYTYTIAGSPPCVDVTAEINVIIIPEPYAGVNATINLCSNDGTIDLFDSLGGTPDAGGTWSPALTSGTNIFDPLVDTVGTYTYTVLGTSPCANTSATATVSVTPFQNAGTDGAVTACTDDGTINLFDSLGGSPETGGTWSPALASGTGIFAPLVDAEATYTYTTSGSGPCSNDSAEVEVTVVIAPDAGTNGTLTLCSLNNSVDLFDSLEGSPQPGGTWTPALTSTTGVFDPNVDSDGIYTYTISSICGDVSATVSVTVIDANAAGNNGAIEICANSTTVDLFNSLGGTPDVGGTWTPALSSGTGVFDPNTDSEGVYTYTVSNSATVCPDASAIVTVTLLQEPNAGNDGTLNLCNTSNSVDLFDSLAGTPDVGGTWTPALSSGTGVFNPNTDPEGVYTYILNNSCGNNSATVTVSLSNSNNAGTDGTIELCTIDANVNLFNSLGGTPDVGGTWSPALSSGTGIFNPNIDLAGTYTYTVSNSSTLCPNASADVIVSILQEPSAGSNGTLNLCNSTNTVDLFNSLSGTPETAGTWSPALTSGSGIFDPNSDPEGIYTYTITNSCGTNSATVTVSYSGLNDAGTNGTIALCSNDASVDLFNSLGGTPNVGGTWSPALSSGTGIFNPSIDAGGTYTYTVSSNVANCPDASATVIVSLSEGPNAGNNGTLNLCNSATTVNLFNSLSGSPETGGTWSPTLASGSGIFDPNIDAEGIYTYSLNNSCGSASAIVTVSLSGTNNAGTDGSKDLCNTDSSINLFDLLGGTPDVGGTWSPTLSSGTGIFNPNIDAAGTYTYTVSNSSTNCPAATADVVITVSENPNAGSNGTLNLCNSTNTINLFDSLGGTPETGGIWSPALASGSGIFNPNVDPEGSYTYTVNNVCGSQSATVLVSLSDLNDVGTNGTLQLCSNATSVDLFNSLGGTPDVGGTWSPALTSGTGMFDPNVDLAGIYTYTISGNGTNCPDVSATVEVTFEATPNAGTNGTIDICDNSTDAVDLFDSLEGTPETGGFWSPALTSGTGVFDPTTDTASTYTYTLNNTCGTSSATVTVTTSTANDAGVDGTIELCSNDVAVDLFNSLGGTPQTDGVWVPALTSGTGVFDPAIDVAGVYTYLVADNSSGCPDATASVTVTILAVPDAGTDNNLNLCIDETDSVDLFNSLGATADSGGVWSPAMASGTGVFDPVVDAAGVYTYTVTSTECNLTSTAEITVTILTLPDVSGLSMEVVDDNIVCVGVEDAIINITGANLLPDGDYSIVYQLSDANISVNTAAISIAGGNATFTIPQILLPNPGETLVTLSQLFVLGQSCSALTNSVMPIKIFVEEAQPPQFDINGTEFCLNQVSTIQDLTNNVINNTGSVTWYNQPTEGIAYDVTEVLQEDVIYYGATTTENGCVSELRTEVSISFISCIGTLKIPDGFSPNDDGINDVFDIEFLNDLYPNFKLSIYNRYGNILYEGDINSPKWDGTWKNNDKFLPVGVYFYILEFNDGETEPKQGRVYLSR